jgi:hypothetical protein
VRYWSFRPGEGEPWLLERILTGTYEFQCTDGDMVELTAGEITVGDAEVELRLERP